jgi:hypothetical protein
LQFQLPQNHLEGVSDSQRSLRCYQHCAVAHGAHSNRIFLCSEYKIDIFHFKEKKIDRGETTQSVLNSINRAQQKLKQEKQIKDLL